MQLDPSAPLKPQLEAITGDALERLVAASAARVGYFVLRNVCVDMEGELVAESDVFASLMTPLREQRVVIECKGGQPKPTDIRKFAPMRRLLSPNPDDLLLVVRHGYPDNRKSLATKLDVRVIERTNLAYYSLPLLGGAALRARRVVELNRCLAWHVVHEWFVARAATGPQIVKKHLRFLTHDLWAVAEPLDQVKRSFSAYTGEFAATWTVVATEKNLKETDETYEAKDDDFQTATYVATLHRMINVYAVVRRALEIVQHESPGELVETTGVGLRDAISQLSERPMLLPGFLSFVQTFWFLWGGFFVKSRRDEEVSAIAEDQGVSKETIEHYLKVLAGIFEGPGAKLTREWTDYWYFMHIPAAFRALGFIHRESRFSQAYAGREFFGKCDPHYRAALERALGPIGGVAALKVSLPAAP